MLTIELSAPVVGEPCKCCGGRTTKLTRFVYSDGDAYAVYWAIFSENHPHRFVSVLISIGEWTEDAPPSRRCSFYVQIWTKGDNYQVSVRDAAESPWDTAEFMGRTLDRAEGLAHPRIKDVFHITDHIVVEDTPIIEYLNANTDDP